MCIRDRISTDSPSYVSALRSALRESPDVILLGEMRDYETIEVAMTAAETGQLLFSTLHTTGAVSYTHLRFASMKISPFNRRPSV